MTDKERTIAYLEEMGYEKVDSGGQPGRCPIGAPRRFYCSDTLICVDSGTFNFNEDGSLAGIGYIPSDIEFYSEWKDDEWEDDEDYDDFDFYGREDDGYHD
jgi:hypothetical protein